MKKYINLPKTEEQWIGLTSLSLHEFRYLLEYFVIVWEKEMKYKTFNNKQRERTYSERTNSVLPGCELKLFFVLYYLKTNPLQVDIAYRFGMSQPQVSNWFSMLLQVLDQSLRLLKCIPVRRGFEVVLKINRDVELYLQDATERAVPRPLDYEVQKEFYSGKKKMHTIKNNILSDEHCKILYLSPTYEGKAHDKKIAEESELRICSESILLQDLGYQGYSPEGENIKVIMPKKKPCGKKLCQQQKDYNYQVSKPRVRIEHRFSHWPYCT